MPTALVTKCAFGNPDLSRLYITTCPRRRDPAIDPMAAHLFAMETEFRGGWAAISREVERLQANPVEHVDVRIRTAVRAFAVQ